MIPALSFVAIEDTVAAFDQLSNHCGALEQPVLEYFETYYIGELRRGRRLSRCFHMNYGICIHVYRTLFPVRIMF